MDRFLQVSHKNSVRIYCLQLEIPQTRSSSNVSSLDRQSQSINIHLVQISKQKEIQFEAIVKFQRKSDPHVLIMKLCSLRLMQFSCFQVDNFST